MKHHALYLIAFFSLPAAATGQQVDVDPISSSRPQPVDTPAVTARTDLSPETLEVLRDIRELTTEREAEIQRALNLQSEAEANVLLDTILADERREEVRERLKLDVVNRTQADRDAYVSYMTRRLRGEATLEEAPAAFRSRVEYRDPRTDQVVVRTTEPRYFGDGRRVITYRTREEIPPVLLASGKLQRVEIAEVAGSPFRNDLVLVDDMPQAYIEPGAYAVSYVVDPASRITRDDILFTQGTTNFADAYSYDIVVDLAMAMQDPTLESEAFIVEGHASAEGDYSSNLALSQARAERIVREIVRYGVSPSRLVPVGYGETEADYPANAAENLRATDRRVSVFRLE